MLEPWIAIPFAILIVVLGLLLRSYLNKNDLPIPDEIEMIVRNQLKAAIVEAARIGNDGINDAQVDLKNVDLSVVAKKIDQWLDELIPDQINGFDTKFVEDFIDQTEVELWLEALLVQLQEAIDQSQLAFDDALEEWLTQDA